MPAATAAQIATPSTPVLLFPNSAGHYLASQCSSMVVLVCCQHCCIPCFKHSLHLHQVTAKVQHQNPTAPVSALGLCPAKLLHLANHDSKHLGARRKGNPFASHQASLLCSCKLCVCGDLCHQSSCQLCCVKTQTWYLCCTSCPPRMPYAMRFASLQQQRLLACSNTSDSEEGSVLRAQRTAALCMQGLYSGWNICINDCSILSKPCAVVAQRDHPQILGDFT